MRLSFHGNSVTLHSQPTQSGKVECCLQPSAKHFARPLQSLFHKPCNAFQSNTLLHKTFDFRFFKVCHSVCSSVFQHHRSLLCPVYPVYSLRSKSSLHSLHKIEQSTDCNLGSPAAVQGCVLLAWFLSTHNPTAQAQKPRQLLAASSSKPRYCVTFLSYTLYCTRRSLHSAKAAFRSLRWLATQYPRCSWLFYLFSNASFEMQKV